MDISGEYRVVGDREAVWRALNDPELLRRCIPGCECLEQLDETHYNATVRLSIGPVSAALQTRIAMTNVNWPESYRLEGDGRAGPMGFGKGHADVRLTEEGEFTTLRYAAALQVGGRFAQLGSRLIGGATRSIVDEFFARLSRNIDAGAERVDSRPRVGRVAALALAWGCGIVIVVLAVLSWVLIAL